MGHWNQVDIGGKPAQVFLPSRRLPSNFVLLFLHGHGLATLENNAVYTAHLERLGMACVCPQGKRSWWGNRVCREFDPTVTPVEYLREAVLPWIEANCQAAPPAIGLLGVSMGGQGALRLAYRFPQQFPVVAALAPAVDFHIWQIGRAHV